MAFAVLFGFVQYHGAAKETQRIFVCLVVVVLHYEIVHHTGQHLFVYAHKETLQIQFHYIAVLRIVFAALAHVLAQHIDAVQLPFAFSTVESARAKYLLKQRLQS